MQDIIKTILRNIDIIHTNDYNDSIYIVYDKNEIDHLLEKCKLLERIINNQYFSNLVSDLETNIEHNMESIYTHNILNLIKLYFNQIA